MRQSILELKGFNVSEWIVSLGEPLMSCRDGEMLITQSNLGKSIMAYRDQNYQLKNLSELALQYNNYEITTYIETTGGIDVEVGISKYYANGTSATTFYPPNQPIHMLSEGIDSMYIVLRFIGMGKVTLKQLHIQAVEKIYLNYETDKVRKIDVFYNEWKQNKEKSESLGKKKYPFKIACILDEFSYECWKYEAELMQLTYDKWQEEIEAFAPDILLVESAWQGKNGSWINHIARLGAFYDEEIKKLTKYCKEKKIPTVFWDKEGLNNFYLFVSTASLFDYIGVTDEHILDIHQAMHPKEHVFLLPFAAQPMLHNSEGWMKKPLGQVAFAGSWYGNKYPRRMKDMEVLLKPSIAFDLDIYDRNYDKVELAEAQGWQWPSMYQSCIVGRLPYLAMVEAYKQYKVFLNVQSIHESKWMIPRRVYELLACGTPVISSYSQGIESQFRDEVYISRSESETKYFLEQILGETDGVKIKRETAQKKILADHTYSHRLEKIIEKL